MEEEQLYSVPDGYGYIPHKGKFTLVRASYYSDKIPLEEMRDEQSQVKPILDETTKRARKFENLNDALRFAWAEVEKKYL